MLRAVKGAAAALAAFATLGAGTAMASGDVYTLTNSTSGNEVQVFDRGGDGSLSTGGQFATGGEGSGGGLGSQGALVLDGDRLYAVNAGSDEVSVFDVDPDGLHLLDTAPSGGDHPISLTFRDGLLYVLNDGGDGSIAGLTVSANGQLAPIAGSSRPLSQAGGAGPAQIEFSPDGGVLVVTEKGTNLIDTYTVGSNGLASGPATHASEGATPFGFAFDGAGRLIVSEAFGGAADQSALSSYDVSPSGVLSTISASVGTTETAACWVVVTRNGRFAYTTNTGSDSVSGYRIGHDGSLELLDADGRTGETGAGPIDMALTRDSRFLYTLDGGSHGISVFRVGGDGSLESIGGPGGLPASAVGLAAR